MRISDDREGKRAGVQRQRQDCVAECERRGWTVAGTYEDNSRSAYSGKERPEYERLTQDVAAGAVDAVVAWHTDRLWRNVMDKEQFLTVASVAGLKVIVAGGQEFDPASADSGFLSTILAAVAQKESADKARRQARKHVERAQAGKAHGGRRCYGYNFADGTIKPVAQEARVIREIAKRMIAGETGNSIVLDLQRRGIKTAMGKEWRVDTLHDLMVRPILAGLREHNGVIYPGNWKPIISAETHEQLKAVAVVRANAVREQFACRTPRVNLLTGLLRCGKCNARLRPGNTGKKRVYMCPSKSAGGCGGIKIIAEQADTAVLQKVWLYLTDGEFEKRLSKAQAEAAKGNAEIAKAVEALQADRSRLTQIGDDYADGIMERPDYVRQTERLRARIAANEALVMRSSAVSASASADPSEVAKVLTSATLVEQRNVIAGLASHFVVLPAPKPVNRPQPLKRLRPVWKLA